MINRELVATFHVPDNIDTIALSAPAADSYAFLFKRILEDEDGKVQYILHYTARDGITREVYTNTYTDQVDDYRFPWRTLKFDDDYSVRELIFSSGCRWLTPILILPGGDQLSMVHCLDGDVMSRLEGFHVNYEVTTTPMSFAGISQMLTVAYEIDEACKDYSNQSGTDWVKLAMKAYNACRHDLGKDNLAYQQNVPGAQPMPNVAITELLHWMHYWEVVFKGVELTAQYEKPYLRLSAFSGKFAELQHTLEKLYRTAGLI